MTSTPQVANCASALPDVPPSCCAAVVVLAVWVGVAAAVSCAVSTVSGCTVSAGPLSAVSLDSEPVTVSAAATVGSDSAESVAQTADGSMLKVSAIVKRKAVSCRVRLVIFVLCPPVQN